MSGANAKGAGSTYAAPVAKKGTGAAMAGGNPGRLALEDRDREFNDFYPTPRAVTQALVAQYAQEFRDMVVWEPCAGDGAMADVLKPAVRSIVATDIESRRKDVAMVDIFDPRLENAAQFRLGITGVVTNPPFNLAVKIIERIVEPGFLPNLRFFALVLKATFWHAKTRLPLFERSMPFAVHPLTWLPDFKGLGRPTMDCMWCVWTPGSRVDGTLMIPLKEPES